MKRNIVATFKPHGEGLAKLFGSLEASIMELLWQQSHASARDIFEQLRDQGQRLSYGAIKTVLDRLVTKQVLIRTMTEAHQYLYQPVAPREEYMRSAVGEIITSLFDTFGEPACAQFLDQIKADPDQLARLSQLIDDAETRQQRGS